MMNDITPIAWIDKRGGIWTNEHKSRQPLFSQDQVNNMTKWTEQDERRLTLLEQQVNALLAGRERMGERIMRLRAYIASNCQHAAFEADCVDGDCPTCEFLRKDAAS